MKIPFKIISSKEKREIIKNYLEDKNSYLVPGVYNTIAAIIAEKIGFKVLHVGGASISLSRGLPDLALIKPEELATEYNRISSMTNLPIIADGESGFENVAKTVKILEKSGVAGIHIEDQVYLKKCGHLPGKKLVSIEKMVKRIKIALKSRKDKNFLIIARTDARNVFGFEETLKRAKAYSNAGADVIFPEALFSKEEFKIFKEEIDKPLLANMTEFGLTPYIKFKEFEKIGYKFVIFPVTAMRATIKTLEEVYKELKNKGTQKYLIEKGKLKDRKKIQELIRYDEWEKLLRNSLRS